MMWTDLIYPASTEEPAVAGRGRVITTTYMIPFESIAVNMGDLLGDVKESGSKGLETALKSSEAPSRSQRGRSTRRAGKPSTGGRATPLRGGCVVILSDVKAWEASPMPTEHSGPVNSSQWGRRVR